MSKFSFNQHHRRRRYERRRSQAIRHNNNNHHHHDRGVVSEGGTPHQDHHSHFLMKGIFSRERSKSDSNLDREKYVYMIPVVPPFYHPSNKRPNK